MTGLNHLKGDRSHDHLDYLIEALDEKGKGKIVTADPVRVLNSVVSVAAEYIEELVKQKTEIQDFVEKYNKEIKKVRISEVSPFKEVLYNFIKYDVSPGSDSLKCRAAPECTGSPVDERATYPKTTDIGIVLTGNGFDKLYKALEGFSQNYLSRGGGFVVEVAGNSFSVKKEPKSKRIFIFLKDVVVEEYYCNRELKTQIFSGPNYIIGRTAK